MRCHASEGVYRILTPPCNGAAKVEELAHCEHKKMYNRRDVTLPVYSTSDCSEFQGDKFLDACTKAAKATAAKNHYGSRLACKKKNPFSCRPSTSTSSNSFDLGERRGSLVVTAPYDSLVKFWDDFKSSGMNITFEGGNGTITSSLKFLDMLDIPVNSPLDCAEVKEKDEDTFLKACTEAARQKKNDPTLNCESFSCRPSTSTSSNSSNLDSRWGSLTFSAPYDSLLPFAEDFKVSGMDIAFEGGDWGFSFDDEYETEFANATWMVRSGNSSHGIDDHCAKFSTNSTVQV